MFLPFTINEQESKRERELVTKSECERQRDRKVRFTILK